MQPQSRRHPETSKTENERQQQGDTFDLSPDETKADSVWLAFLSLADSHNHKVVSHSLQQKQQQPVKEVSAERPLIPAGHVVQAAFQGNLATGIVLG